MRRIAFTLGYDGTDYAGWQVQENGLSVQQVLEETFEKLFHEKVKVMGSGRTDAGVSARGQTACVDLAHPIPAENLKNALNANLPEDIRIYDVWEAPADFNPRFAAKKKTYVYRFVRGSVMPPEYRRHAALLTYPFEEEPVRKALKALEGEHDFTAFRASGGENLSCVRTIYKAILKGPWPIDGTGCCLYEIEVTGNGFLYHMVRIIAGTMAQIGCGKLSPDVIEEALRTGSRDVLGATAPPQGLMLMQVEYDPAVSGQGTAGDPENRPKVPQIPQTP